MEPIPTLPSIRSCRPAQLSQADKRLVTELVYGTVARKITLEWYLAHEIADRDQLDSWVYYLLLLSLYQLLYLDKIPNHAVVNEAVNLAKRAKGTDKYVNAILRAFLNKPLPEITPSNAKTSASVQYSAPVWLVAILIEEYGQERAEAILASLFVRNKASVRVTDLSKVDEVARTLRLKNQPFHQWGWSRLAAILLAVRPSRTVSSPSRTRPVNWWLLP